MEGITKEQLIYVLRLTDHLDKGNCLPWKYNFRTALNILLPDNKILPNESNQA